MNDSNLIFALEIGTDKMLALAGEISAKDKINILSLGQERSKKSIKKGDIINAHEATNLAQSAISRAERECKSSSASVYLAVSGSKVKGFQSIGSATPSGIDSTIRSEDLQRATNDAKSKTLPEGRSFFHRFRCEYYIDGIACSNPIGKKADVLEAEYWLMHGDDESICSAIEVVESFGMDVKEIMHAGVASAYATTTLEQRKRGVLVVDIGRGTTDYAYIVNDAIRQAGTIPIGGDHITNDISLGLQLNFSHAESLKIEYGKIILSEEERKQNICLYRDKIIGYKEISYDSLNKIICARFEELFTLLRKELEPQISGFPISEIVLTGGVAYTNGLTNMLCTIFNAPCEVAKFAEWIKPELRKQEYSTALGLLIKASENIEKSDGSKKKKFFSW